MESVSVAPSEDVEAVRAEEAPKGAAMAVAARRSPVAVALHLSARAAWITVLVLVLVWIKVRALRRAPPVERQAGG